MIPLYHDLTDERVVIVGGGKTAARKARRFSREATVTVVAPEPDERFEDMEGVEVVEEKVEDEEDASSHVADAFLVVTATPDPEVNQAVSEAAKESGALVNRADTSDVEDAVVPATVETDEVSVAVSTHGSAPAVSRYLRRRIEETVEDENIDGLVRLQDEIREELKREVREQDERSRLLRELIRNDEVRRLLSSDDTDYGEVLGRVREIVLGENDENGDGDEDADKDGDG